jgi:hypothetical protein
MQRAVQVDVVRVPAGPRDEANVFPPLDGAAERPMNRH